MSEALTIAETGKLVEVKSDANPTSVLLLEARRVVQGDQGLRQAFVEAKKQGLDRDYLADALFTRLKVKLPEAENSELWEASTYLADEYAQVGDSVLLISMDTGKALMRISEEDLWQPPPVERESGSVVQRAPRLRPDLEGALVQWCFDKEREENVVSTLLQKLPQTELVRLEGDPRLLVTSRKGRGRLVDRLRELLLDLIPKWTSGASKTFLESLIPDGPHVGSASIQRVAMVQVSALIADFLSLNLRYAVLDAILVRVANGWTRDIARHLADTAKKQSPTKRLSVAEAGALFEGKFWVMPPDVARVCPPSVPVLVVDGSPVVGVPLQGAGAVQFVPTSFECRGREVFERWEVSAKCEFTIWADWQQLVVLDLTDVPVSGTSVEVVSL